MASDVTKDLKEKIEELTDIVEAMMLCDEYNVPYDGIETFGEFQDRLRLECERLDGVQYKAGIEKALKEVGKEDFSKRQRLKQMFVNMLSIIEIEKGARKERFRFVEKSLETEGTTSDVSGDCRKRIEDLEQGDSVILVAGESSAGKSSVLNLLLGEDILPFHTNSCTAVITVIKYDKYRRAKVFYKDGGEKEIKKLDQNGKKELHDILFPNQESLRMGHDLKEIHLFLPLPFLQTGLVLADTPGIGENDFLEDYLVDYISNNQILGFMYIIMSDAAGGVKEDRLLNLLKIIVKEQKKTDSGLRFDPKAALFVCNRFDMIPQEDRPTVKTHIMERLGSCWPDFDTAIAIPFSTMKAKRDVAAHPDYINGQYKQLLEGLKNLFIAAMDRRIRSSYKWIEKLLKRIIHYLKGKLVRLDMSQRDLHTKTAMSKQRLMALKDKSTEYLNQMRADLDIGVDNICTDVRKYIGSPAAKMKLTGLWNDSELPNVDESNEKVSAADWVKDKLEDLFHDRLCDMLEEWDKDERKIQFHEDRMTKDIRSRLNLLEEDITDIEEEMQGDKKSETNIPANKFRFSVSIPEGSFELAHLQVKFSNKAVTRMRNPIARLWKPTKARRFLHKYKNDPKGVATKKALKFRERLLAGRHEKDELKPFVRQLMQRPYEYLNILERKLPNLIRANEESLAEAEETAATERQYQAKYVELMTSVEELRKCLMDYGEGYIFVNDFKSDEIKIEQETMSGCSISKTFKVVNILDHGSTDDQRGQMFNPIGLWSTVYSGKLCRLNEEGTTQEKPIAIRMYMPSSGVDHTFQEVAKLRCLIHHDMFLAEFLGIHHADALTPAYIYDGQLRSVRRFLQSCTNPRCVVPRVLLETLRGLQYLHIKGLVHMEVTRNTVTVDDSGSVRLTGACLPREARVPVDYSIATADFVYLPPEVLKGMLYISAADVYCFGLMFYELVCKDKIVFREQKKVAFHEFVEKHDPVGMLQLEAQGKRISDDIQALIKDCVSPNPTERPTAEEATERLKAFQDKMTLSDSGPATPAAVFRLSMSKQIS